MQSSGDVVELDLGLPHGREAGFVHPAIVVTSQRILDAGPSVIHVVPVTSTIRAFRSEVTIEPDGVNGLDVVSSAQCQHVRSIAPRRISATLGTIDASTLAQIRETLAVLLDLPG